MANCRAASGLPAVVVLLVVVVMVQYVVSEAGARAGRVVLSRQQP
jgi:hypothetical protein